MRIKKRILFVIFWITLVTSFLFSAFLILLKANGYQLNYKNWKIIQTGMIILSGDPNAAQVTINGRKLGHLPIRLTNLSPGNYEVTIVLPGYSLWQRKIRVEEGKASSFQNITLFFKQAKEYLINEENLTAENLSQEATRYTRELKISGAEIFFEEKLVTRFSQNVLAASLYPDNKHIVFQTGKEIRVVELDGSNNSLLFSLNSSEPTVVSFRDNGREIIYLDQGKIAAKTIR